MAYYLSYAPFYHYGNGDQQVDMLVKVIAYYGGNLPLYSATGGSQTAGGIGNTEAALMVHLGKVEAAHSNSATVEAARKCSINITRRWRWIKYWQFTFVVIINFLTKHMTCYNCSTSSVSSTKTITTTNVSATATVGLCQKWVMVTQE